MEAETLPNISEETLEEEGSDAAATPSSGPRYKAVDENNMLEILNRMNRVVKILKVRLTDWLFSFKIRQFIKVNLDKSWIDAYLLYFSY